MTGTRWKWLLVGLGAPLFLLAALHGYVNGNRVRGWMRSRIEKSLRARFDRVELGNDLSVDWSGRVSLGPVSLLRAQGAILSVDSVLIRPSYRALLAGRLEAAVVTLNGVQVDLDRVKELLSGRGNETSVHAMVERAPHRIVVRANEIRFRTHRASLIPLLSRVQPLFGRFHLHIAGADSSIEGSVSFGEGGALAIHLPPRRDGRIRFDTTLETRHLAELLKPYEDSPFIVEDGELKSQLTVDAEEGLHQGQLSGTVSIRNLRMDGERLHSEALGPLDLSFGATVRWEDDGRQIHLAKTEIGLGEYRPLPIQLTGRLDRSSEPSVDLVLSIRGLDFTKLLRALPPQLSPGEEVPSVDGSLAADFRLKGPSPSPEKLELTAKLDLSRLHSSPKGPPRLASSFEYRPASERGPAPLILVGEKNPSFVSLSTIPPFVVSAVTLSEDAGFFGHRGFDFQEIKESVVDATEERRFRGASTITQQLAKNLYLSREKTYARKIREAIATLALEASLPKSRILEIYLNIIEWGPGIYGLGQAAQHYFGRDVDDLTPKQAAFLASIIPNPLRYYVYYRQGALSEVWEKRVHELLVKMRDRNIITDSQFSEAEETPLVFTSVQAKN